MTWNLAVPSEIPLAWGMMYWADCNSVRNVLQEIKEVLEKRGEWEGRCTKAMFSERCKASALVLPRMVPLLVSHSADLNW